MKQQFSKISILATLMSLNFLHANQNTIININIAKPPEVPKVQFNISSVTLHTYNLQTKFEKKVRKKSNYIGSSKRIPPHYKEKQNPKLIKNIKISAYLKTNFIPKKDLITKLEQANFKILSEYNIDKKGNLIALIFTNDEITNLASKNSRGFASSLRLLIDKKNSIISISNPVYLMKAFLQNDYNEKIATKTLEKLHTLFIDLKDSKDLVKFTRLNRYHFMSNMPYYQDMQKVAIGNNKDLLQKAKKSNKIVYEQHLNNGSVMIGVKLSRSTSRFVKKIGYQNSELLPYPILIENNVAKILDPKYYIAVMYPMLSMSEFMTIASIPDSIQKDCDKVFR